MLSKQSLSSILCDSRRKKTKGEFRRVEKRHIIHICTSNFNVFVIDDGYLGEKGGEYGAKKVFIYRYKYRYRYSDEINL